MKREQLEKELTEVDKNIEAQRETLNALISNRNALKIAIFKIDSGLQVGDEVQYKDGKTVKTGVVDIFKIGYGNATVVVKLHKSDGTLGLRTKDYWFQGLPTKI